MEIKVAHQLGKPIISVYESSLKDDVELPDNLKKYATSIVGWRAESIIEALDGNSQFQHADGREREKINGGNIIC